jgi:hypothetical protein
MALVAANGNGRQAEKSLREDGIEIDPSTLYRWKTDLHRDEYERLREEMLPRIRKQQADAHRTLEARQLEISLQAANEIAQRLPNMEDRDRINAMGKLDIGSGIHGEKAQLLDDQPTHIVQRSATEILRNLKHRGVILEGEVVEEETVALDSGDESHSQSS